MPDLLIRDEELSGELSQEYSLSFLTEHITVRELIRSRVYQEVQDYNTTHPEQRRKRLVLPPDSTTGMPSDGSERSTTVNWQVPFQLATTAFEEGRIIILINDQQAESLEQQFEITPKTVVTFLKLTLLVGG